MGACETTPPTTRDRGNQTSDLRTRQPAGGCSSLPIIGRRLPASSSFVLAAARLRALQLDTAQRGGTNRQRRGKATTTIPPRSRAAANQVTGLTQHCLLTTGAPMGANATWHRYAATTTGASRPTGGGWSSQNRASWCGAPRPAAPTPPDPPTTPRNTAPGVSPSTGPAAATGPGRRIGPRESATRGRSSRTSGSRTRR
jgi:hypothetical protein